MASLKAIRLKQDQLGSDMNKSTTPATALTIAVSPNPQDAQYPEMPNRLNRTVIAKQSPEIAKAIRYITASRGIPE